MIRYLECEEVLDLHRRILLQTGGMGGIRDMGGLESAIAQPQMTFDGRELYPTISEKGTSLGFSLVCNHPFFDGNKRIGHAAMEVFFFLNGWELVAGVNEQEQVILSLAAGNLARDAFAAWVVSHLHVRLSEGSS